MHLLLTLIIDDLVDTDLAFEAFLRACQRVCVVLLMSCMYSLTHLHQAGPDRCALASNKSTASSIGARVDKLLDDLYEYPLPVVKANRPGMLTSGIVKGTESCHSVTAYSPLRLLYRLYLFLNV